jgi:phosphoribosylformylglycinamidine synthase
MKRFYRKIDERFEYCFNIEIEAPLSSKDLEVLKWLLAETFEPEKFGNKTFLGSEAIEFGPRLNYATPWSTNAVNICHSLGLKQIKRIERSRRIRPSKEADQKEFISSNHDRMTEMVYQKPLRSFSTGIKPDNLYNVPLMKDGVKALFKIPGFSLDKADAEYLCDYFVRVEKRDPTIVEIMDLNNANSEHSRHGYFRGKQVIDGVEMPETLMDIVKSTWHANHANSVIAFSDNSSAIEGFSCWTIIPEYPGRPSDFQIKELNYHIIFTAETHNFPSGVAPFPGAETGTGGRIRDDEDTGRGGLVIAGTAGYCMSNLFLPGYRLPWENRKFKYPSNLASGLRIEIEASNGASDYGNKFGEPVIQGFTRSFDLRLPNGERWAWIKPIMFTGGIGQINALHIKKRKPKKGMLIVQVGGPAYRIGFGGGAASSMLQGDNLAELDFNAVQRGDAEMENKMNRVIRACIEMGILNPIMSAHDQGAGGPANILKELVEMAGGLIRLVKINVGDPTMSTLEIWVCEYQERGGFLIWPDRIEEFKAICEREKVNCEVLGEVTGDGRFVVYDERDGSKPVDLDLKKVLGNLPQKTFRDNTVKHKLKPLKLPEGLIIGQALERILKLISVGSKRFLTSKVDRSVTGLVARQQCVSPLQLSLSDVAVVAQSHFPNKYGKYTGAATAIGEQPIKMLFDPEAGARMAVAEALSNLVWAKITHLEDVKCSANWMWAPKLPGEGAALYKAASAMRDLMIELGIAVDGGKDSLSMATRVDNEIVKSSRQLVISAYAPVPDVEKVITPEFKEPGNSLILYIPLSKKYRLGGSALAQVYKQIGNDCPDIEDPSLLKRSFNIIQEMIDRDLILAGHDISDGGLITALCEMAFAGDCGFAVDIGGQNSLGSIQILFAEEAGFLMECSYDKIVEMVIFIKNNNFHCFELGKTIAQRKLAFVTEKDKETILDMRKYRSIWEETSFQLEKKQTDIRAAKEEKANIYEVKINSDDYRLSFYPEVTEKKVLRKRNKPRVAVLREEGTNGDREMASAFVSAGFAVKDITMSDLLAGKADLDDARGLVFPGGFSYADVLDSAKGWAAVCNFNPNVKKILDNFYDRPDTFSLGVCNGCQLMALLGWVPWRGIPIEKQPRFIKNLSGRFESRWVRLQIDPSSAIMLRGMEGSRLGVWVAHGEGRIYFPDKEIWLKTLLNNQIPLAYLDDKNLPTEQYPFNPNGSPSGITALCSPDGRHLAMMPHPERTFLKWQWAYLPGRFKKEWSASPWLKMFQNAREWCDKN